MRFPIIALTRNSPVVCCLSTIEPLRHANARGLRDPTNDGVFVVDSELHSYSVKFGKILSGRGPFSGYNIWFNRRVVVELVIEDEDRIVSLHELKEMIRSWLPSDAIEEFYDESLDPNEDRPFLERLEQADTFVQVCKALGQDPVGQYDA
jgi:hypothetical protein